MTANVGVYLCVTVHFMVCLSVCWCTVDAAGRPRSDMSLVMNHTGQSSSSAAAAKASSSSMSAGVVSSLRCACDKLQRRCDDVNIDYCTTNSTVCLHSLCTVSRSVLTFVSALGRMASAFSAPSCEYLWCKSPGGKPVMPTADRIHKYPGLGARKMHIQEVH